MIGWEQEPFELINEGHFRITDAGPLHTPIHSFSIRRDDKLRLILETRAPTDAKSSAPEYPSGTLRLNTDTVQLTNISGIRAVLSGIQPYRVQTSNNYAASQHELQEEASINRIDVVILGDETPAYTVDWLDNVPTSPFVWPDSIKTVTATTETSTIGLGDDGITLFSAENNDSFSRTAAKIVVGGVDAYLCALSRKEASGRLKPGRIIYVGAPDEEIRKKVKNALSFALGVYLVDLGSTAYSKSWEVQSFRSKSAYSIDRKVFDLPVLPPAPLGMKWQHEIDRVHLGRMVNAIFAKYDELNFGDLNWAYWHALCATPHIAGVHFGAAIEALQRRYMAANPTKIATKIISDRTVWTSFSDEIERAISALRLSEESKAALRQNVGSLNRVPQRAIAESLLREINIELGRDEAQAWKRRNDAAHGMEMEAGGELSLIEDTRLLKVIFHRMLLRITNGSDSYFDYSSAGFPIRKLHEAASAPPASIARRGS